MSMISLNPGPLFSNPGFNQTHTPMGPAATESDIKETFKREEYNSRFDWPPDSPVAEVYDVQNTPAKMVLLNNRAKPRSASHLRGHTDRVDLRATTPNPDRHTLEMYPKKNPDRHVMCADSKSPRFVRKPQKDNMWVSPASRTRKSSEGESSTSSRASSGHSEDKNRHATTRKSSGHPNYSVSPAYFTAPKCGIPKKQRKPPISMQDNSNLVQNMTKGNKAYLWSIAQVYDVSRDKQYKQHQYKALVLKEVLRGFHTMEECRKYLNYLDGPRQRPYGSADPGSKSASTPRGAQRRSKTPTGQKKKTEKEHISTGKDKSSDIDDRSIASSKSSRRSSTCHEKDSDCEDKVSAKKTKQHGGGNSSDTESTGSQQDTGKMETDSQISQISGDPPIKNRKTSPNRNRLVDGNKNKVKEGTVGKKHAPDKSKDTRVQTRMVTTKKDKPKKKITDHKRSTSANVKDNAEVDCDRQMENEKPHEEIPTEVKMEVKIQKKKKDIAPVGTAQKEKKNRTKADQPKAKTQSRSISGRSGRKANTETPDKQDEVTPEKGRDDSEQAKSPDNTDTDSDIIELQGPEGTIRPKSRLGNRSQPKIGIDDLEPAEDREGEINIKESSSESHSVHLDGSDVETSQDYTVKSPVADMSRSKHIYSETDSEDDMNGNNRKHMSQKKQTKGDSDTGESESDSEFPMKYDTKLDTKFTIQPKIEEERQSQTQLEMSKDDSSDADVNGNSQNDHDKPHSDDDPEPESVHMSDQIIDVRVVTAGHSTGTISERNENEPEMETKAPENPIKGEDVGIEQYVSSDGKNECVSGEDKADEVIANKSKPLGEGKLVLYMKSDKSDVRNDEPNEVDEDKLRDEFNISADLPSENDQDQSSSSDSDNTGSEFLHGPEGTTRPKSRLGNRPQSSKEPPEPQDDDINPNPEIKIKQNSPTEQLVEGEYITLGTGCIEDSVSESGHLGQTQSGEDQSQRIHAQDTSVLVSDFGNRLTEDAEPLSVDRDGDLTNQLKSVDMFDDDGNVEELNVEATSDSSPGLHNADTVHQEDHSSNVDEVEQIKPSPTKEKVDMDMQRIPDGNSQGQRKNSLNLLRDWLDSERNDSPDSDPYDADLDTPHVATSGTPNKDSHKNENIIINQDEPIRHEDVNDKYDTSIVPDSGNVNTKDDVKQTAEFEVTSNEKLRIDNERNCENINDSKQNLNDNEALVETKTRKLSVDSSISIKSSSSEETLGRAGGLFD